MQERRKNEGFPVDVLSGLLNRIGLNEALKAMLKLLQRRLKVGMIIAYLDVNNFKLINDILEHYVGDRAIEEVSRRLDIFRDEDLIEGPDEAWMDESPVGRRGGDEFAVALFVAEEDVPVILERLLECQAKAWEFEGSIIPLRFSVGLRFVTPDELQGREIDDALVEELLREADRALIVAKDRGKQKRYKNDRLKSIERYNSHTDKHYARVKAKRKRAALKKVDEDWVFAPDVLQ